MVPDVRLEVTCLADDMVGTLTLATSGWDSPISGLMSRWRQCNVSCDGVTQAVAGTV